MQVQTVGQGPHPDFSLAGSTVTVDGVEIDCDARQTDAQNVIDISRHHGKTQEGGGYLLASIRIPPRQYIEVEDDTAPATEPGEQNMTRQPQPLNAGRVAVTIWPAI